MELGARHEYLFYAPISNTHWYTLTSMAYETVNFQVLHISKFMLIVAVGIFAIGMLIIFVFFTLYRYNEHKHQLLLLSEKEKAEQANEAKSNFVSQNQNSS